MKALLILGLLAALPLPALAAHHSPLPSKWWVLEESKRVCKDDMAVGADFRKDDPSFVGAATPFEFAGWAKTKGILDHAEVHAGDGGKVEAIWIVMNMGGQTWAMKFFPSLKLCQKALAAEPKEQWF